MRLCSAVALRALPAITVLAGGFAAPVLAHDPRSLLVSDQGMVASDSPHASEIGAGVLRAGGNAFDAAIAVSLALTVARPESTGIGGGGFLLAYSATERRFVALDFRECAPAAATPQRYDALHAQRADGAPSPSVYGGNAVGVPGLPAGVDEIHRRFASREFAQLAAPAIELAERGLPVDQHYVDACRAALRDFDRWPEFRERFPALFHRLLGGGEPAAVGARIPRPELAECLREMARHGPTAFYRGAIAEDVVSAVSRAGGALTLDDLRQQRTIERVPLRGRFGDVDIVSMPPPSSGGACLILSMQIIDAARRRSDYDKQDAPHVLLEAFKHAFADRARWMGDPDFCDVPASRLVSPDYALSLAAKIDFTRTFPPEHYGTPLLAAEDSGTSHFCVADRAGNVVAMTETVNGGFGSFVVTERFGILLNNQLDDFLTAPGKANLFGLTQGEANRIGPRKRPLSSMTPTLFVREGRPVLAIGASGGPRIITAVAQVALGVLDGQTLHQAMHAPRWHHQWLPNEAYADREPPRHLREKAQRAGHVISDTRKRASVQAIQFLPDDAMVGTADENKGGRPAAP